MRVAAPQVLSHINLCLSIIITDAIHTQLDSSPQIVETAHHFVSFVKINQSLTLCAIEKLFIHEMCNLRQGALLSCALFLDHRTVLG